MDTTLVEQSEALRQLVERLGFVVVHDLIAGQYLRIPTSGAPPEQVCEQEYELYSQLAAHAEAAYNIEQAFKDVLLFEARAFADRIVEVIQSGDEYIVMLHNLWIHTFKSAEEAQALAERLKFAVADAADRFAVLRTVRLETQKLNQKLKTN